MTIIASDRVPINCAVAGVQKAATSTLRSLLIQHPAVARTRKKELHFFDDESRDWDRPDYSHYAAKRTSDEQTVACDATPVYLFWPPALPRMRAYSPDMRLVAVFRDPVERAFSHWMMENHRSDRTPGFDKLVTRSLNTGQPEVPPGAWHRPASRTRSVVARGFYAYQLQRALKAFPRDQWLLLDFLDLVEDQGGVLHRLTDFLGVAPFESLPLQEQRRKSPSVEEVGPGNPTADVLQRLANAYAADLNRFEQISGINTSRWPTARLLRGDLDAETWAARLRRKTRSP